MIFHNSQLCFLSVLGIVLLTSRGTNAFVPIGTNVFKGQTVRQFEEEQPIKMPLARKTPFPLFASKKKKKGGKKPSQKSTFGGFGGGTATKDSSDSSSIIKPVKADKDSLEAQWDSFAAVTDLEIKPLGNPEDEDYEHFEVVDVFVKSGGDGDSSSGWFRIGKVCASQDATIEVSLTLQKGLIFWTAVHMRRELMALGKASATSLELGYISPAIIYMGTETDGPMEQDEAEAYLKVFDRKASPEELMAIKTHDSIGFRPDWNPPGFTYKRRENAARKEKKKAPLQEALDDEN